MRAVVINLDRSTDRLATFSAQAAQIGLAFERLPAIDAGQVETAGGYLRPGEVACFESHRLAWRMLVASEAPWLAVFEDDACLDPSIVGLLRDDGWIPPGTDLVKLETFGERVALAAKGTPAPGCRLHRLRSTHLGAAGYVISRRWAMELLLRSEVWEHPVDWLLFDLHTDSSPGAVVLQAVPAPCIQEQWLAAGRNRTPLHRSLIEGRGIRPPESQPPRLPKWRREVGRIGRQIRRLPDAIRKGGERSRWLVVPFAGA